MRPPPRGRAGELQPRDHRLAAEVRLVAKPCWQMMVRMQLTCWRKRVDVTASRYSLRNTTLIRKAAAWAARYPRCYLRKSWRRNSDATWWWREAKLEKLRKEAEWKKKMEERKRREEEQMEMYLRGETDEWYLSDDYRTIAQREEKWKQWEEQARLDKIKDKEKKKRETAAWWW